MIRKPDAWLHQGEADFDGHKWVERVQVTTSEQVARWRDKNAQPLFRRTPEDVETLLAAAAALELIEPIGGHLAAKLRELAGDGT